MPRLESTDLSEKLTGFLWSILIKKNAGHFRFCADKWKVTDDLSMCRLNKFKIYAARGFVYLAYVLKLVISNLIQ